MHHSIFNNHPQIQFDILDLHHNVGLAKATNLGVYNAKYEKILIINDDNIFPANWNSVLAKYELFNTIISPNQVEPNPSFITQFIIKDFGITPDTFQLDDWIEYSKTLNGNTDDTGSTLPIYINKFKYLALGGWDENYPGPWVTDWDFFLKANMHGCDLNRIYDCTFYHFASAATKTVNKLDTNNRIDQSCHEYARYKWGAYIKHNPGNNEKYLYYF